MVLYDPVEMPLLQIVRSHPATFKRFFLRRAPAWAKNIEQLSLAQLESVISLAKFMIERARGLVGTVKLPDGRRISKAAYLVKTEYPKKGEGVFGGMTKEERLRRRYKLADANVQRLEKIRAEKRAKPTAAPKVLRALPE